MFTYIGCGSFGKVFASENFPNYVVRISNSYDDTGYTQWIMDILENKFTMRVPKIYMFTIKNGRSFAVLERLHELNREQTNVACRAWDSFICYDTNKLDRFERSLSKVHDYDEIFAAEYMSVFKRSIERRFSFDCSASNIMSRKDGTMIMTDPYFESYLNIDSFNYEIDCEFNDTVKCWMKNYV